MILSICQSAFGFGGICDSINNLFDTTSTDDSFLVHHEFDPKITFRRVIGLPEAQDRLSIILRLLEDPEHLERAGLCAQRFYLLEGPARCGKTHISVALAGEIRDLFIKQNRHPGEFNCYKIHAREIIQETSASRLIDALKRHAPCILLIDEVDLLFQDSMGGNLEEFSLLGALYTNNVHEQIFIIGSTNYYDRMPAIGKFGPHVIHFKSFNPYSITPYLSLPAALDNAHL